MMRVDAPNGRTLVAYADPDRLADHLKGLSPEDAELIDEFCEGIRLFTHFDVSLLQEQPRSMLSAEEWVALGLKMMPYASSMTRWWLVSTHGLGQRFKDLFLREQPAWRVALFCLAERFQPG